MTDFATALNAAVNLSGGVTDINAVVRRCFLFDFDGMPMRLWDGVGRLITVSSHGDAATAEGPGGETVSVAANEWLGFRVPMDEGETLSLLTVPPLKSPRDGRNPDYTFTFNGLDRATADALVNETWRVSGRALTVFSVLLVDGEGLRPQAGLRWRLQLTMASCTFRHSVEWAGDGLRRTYPVDLLARNDNAGRAHAPGNTMNDTGQRRHAASLGVTEDAGGEYVPALAKRTFRFP